MAGPILRILRAVVGADEQVLVLGDSPVRLGRDDDNDVVLLEQVASRHHARIEPVDGGYEIVDAGSSGGLFLRGERVQKHRLVDGDEFKIGGTTLRYVESAGSEPTLAPPVSPPSSLPTEASTAPPPSNSRPTDGDIGDAETMLPEDMLSAPGTVAASHVPAVPPLSSSTQRADDPAPPSTPPLGLEATQQAPQPMATQDPPSQEPAPPSSTPSFVMGNEGPASSWADGSLSPPGAPASPSGSPDGYQLQGSAPSADYSLEGASSSPLGSIEINGDGPPRPMQSSSGAGLFVVFGLVGAVGSFGVLVALYGVPW